MRTALYLQGSLVSRTSCSKTTCAGAPAEPPRRPGANAPRMATVGGSCPSTATDTVGAAAAATAWSSWIRHGVRSPNATTSEPSG